MMIDESDFKILDMRYKRVDACSQDMLNVDNNHHILDKRLAMLEQSQKVNNWLTAAVASGIIALVIKTFFGG